MLPSMKGFGAFNGHLGRISSIVFSADGTRFATAAGDDMTVRIWRLNSNVPERVFRLGPLHAFHSVNSIAFAPGGKSLYAAVSNGIFALDLTTGKQKRIRARDGNFVVLSPTGLAAIWKDDGEEGRTRLLDLARNRFLCPGFQSSIPQAFSRDGAFLRVKDPGNASVIEVATRKVVWTGQDEENVVFLQGEDGPWLAIAHPEPDAYGVPSNVVGIPLGRDAATSAPFEGRHVVHDHDWTEERMALVGSTSLFRCYLHGPAQRFDIGASPTAIEIVFGEQDDCALAVSPTGDWVAIGDTSGGLRLVRTNDLKTEWSSIKLVPFELATVSEDSRMLGTRTELGGTYLWDLERLELVAVMAEGDDEVARWDDFAFDWSLRWLGRADRWTSEESPIGQGLGDRRRFSGIIVRACAVIEPTEDGEDRVNSVDLCENVPPIEDKPVWGEWEDRIRTISHNGRWLGIAGATAAYVIDIATRECIHSLPIPRLTEEEESHFAQLVGIAVSEDGMRLAVGATFCDFDILVFDFEKREVHRRNACCCDTFDSLAFHPDGRFLAVGDAYQPFISLIDPVGRRRLRVVHEHADAIRSLDFSPDGRRLVSAGADGQVILWNATTFEPEAILMILSAPDEPVRWAVLTSDGQVKGSPGIEAEFIEA
jgi:WD40 repeat protein